MRVLIVVPVVVPLLGAALAVVCGRWRAAQRVVSVASLLTTLIASMVLLVRVDDQGIAVTQAGGWPAPLGITLVADRLAAVMVVIAAVMLLGVLVYAIGQGGVELRHVGFHPVYLVLAAGVSLSFVTGDLFNLFVAFEVMLIASYVLLTMGGRPDQVRAGMTYVVVSLVASTLFITALALVYTATGTVNMADLSGRLAELDPSVQAGFALLLLVVFGIKAGLFPLFSWLPDSYPTAPGPVTAVFAGLLTKVGVYAIIRTQTVVFTGDARQGTLLLAVAALTMAVGVLGAIAQDDMKRILSFHIISQIGYMIFGLGLFTVAGLAGAVFYVVHNIAAKTTLLLVAGLVDRLGGSCRLSEVGGVVRRAPVLALLFGLPALSLAGVPPFSGFVGKYALLDAGFDERQWVVAGVSLAVGLLTMFSMVKIWTGVFWGEPEEAPARTPVPAGVGGGPLPMVAATAALAVVSVGLAVCAGPLWELSERTAADLLEPQRYVEAVLGARA